MTEDVILDDGDPSPETLKKWAYDERISLIEQDEDLVLHRVQYVPLLIQFASDKECSKRGYIASILGYFSQLSVLFKQYDSVRAIDEAISQRQPSSVPPLEEWVQFFNRIKNYLLNPRPLTEDEALQMAMDLFNGSYCSRRVAKIGTRAGYTEFKCWTGSYEAYLYVRQSDGMFHYSQWRPLTSIGS